MNWPTFIASVITAVVVAVLAAFLNPRFQHVFWKKQKLREQRILIAERFAAMNANFILLSPDEATSWPNWGRMLEENGLLVLVQVLFERDDTQMSGDHLRTWLDNHAIQLTGSLPVSQFMEFLALRVDLLAHLFAEAFELSTGVLEKRGPSINKGA